MFQALLVLVGDNPEAVKQIATGLLRLLGLLGLAEELTPEQIAALEQAASSAKANLDAAVEAALRPPPVPVPAPPSDTPAVSPCGPSSSD